MAGRERSGGAAAQADLFDARPWALCPSPTCDAERVRVVELLVRACGADPVRLDAESHDAAVALVSHLPQIAASGVAGMLTEADAVAMVLAGQGLRDTVRIAGSEPTLWSDILTGNAATVAPLVERLAAELTKLGAALRAVGEEPAQRQVDKTIERFLRAGRDGYRAIPGKHGAAPAEYSVVTVVIPDEAGALARLFATVATAGASVEDIQLEHSPGHPVGIIELAVRPDHAAALRAALDRDGWSSH
jgi:prephenate dehydrogenase